MCIRDRYLAGVERFHAGKASRDRGFAATGRSNQTQRGAALDPQLEAAERFDLVLRPREESALAIRLRGASDFGDWHVTRCAHRSRQRSRDVSVLADAMAGADRVN